MKKILITGGNGFIGVNLINFLLKKKFYISNIDKISKVSNPHRYIKSNSNYKFYKLNLQKDKKLNKILLSNYDFIIHLAAESHVDRSIFTPIEFFKENVNSTLILYKSIKNLLKKKKIKNPKIIHISTDEIYGSVKNGSFKENSRTFTSSPYSASKAASENIAQAFLTTFNLKICILRISNNYGPFQNKEKLIPKSIFNLLNKKKVELYSKGENIREWIYVEDTCFAIYEVIKKFKSGEIFNIGSSIKKKNLDVIKTIINLLGLNFNKNLIFFSKDRLGHDYRYSLNSKLFSKKYNWKPKTNFKNGLKKTIKWYIEKH
jgi:dTDP-glucose 4,6-dehydratase